MDNNGRQWTTMDNNRQQWTTIDNNGQQWTTMDSSRQIGSQAFLLAANWASADWAKIAMYLVDINICICIIIKLAWKHALLQRQNQCQGVVILIQIFFVTQFKHPFVTQFKDGNKLFN